MSLHILPNSKTLKSEFKLMIAELGGIYIFKKPILNIMSLSNTPDNICKLEAEMNN